MSAQPPRKTPIDAGGCPCLCADSRPAVTHSHPLQSQEFRVVYEAEALFYYVGLFRF